MQNAPRESEEDGIEHERKEANAVDSYVTELEELMKRISKLEETVQSVHTDESLKKIEDSRTASILLELVRINQRLSEILN